MKIFGNLKRVVVVVIVSLAVIALGYEARKTMMGGIDPRIARENDRREDEQTLAPRLLGQATMARQSGDTQGALRLLKELQKKCPDGQCSATGLAMTVEMITNEEAPANLLPQVYEWTWECRNPQTIGERARLLPHLSEIDATKEWKLHWQMLLQAAGQEKGAPTQANQPAPPAQVVLSLLLDAVRQAEGEDAVTKVLTKALESPGLQQIGGRIVNALLQRTEMSKGADAALALAGKLAKEHAQDQGGAAAFQYACDGTLRLKGDAEVLAFLKECAVTPKDGPVLQAARSRLAAHFIGQGDMESAVAVYCGSAGTDAMLTLSLQTLEQAVDSVVKVANRQELGAVELLQMLAGKASERKLYRISGALYERAALRLKAPELRANEKETPLAEADAPVFWQGYIAWRGANADKGRELYEQLLPKYEEGWQVAQMLYDLAKGHMAALRYDEAVALAERGLKALPGNTAIGGLLKEAQAALDKDNALSDQVLALRKDAESALTPPARAECCMKIAQAETQRQNFEEALKGYREVWEKYPETPDAPKAMYAAAEILIGQLKDNRAAREVIENLVLSYPSSESSAKAFALIKKTEGK